ncbi:MAG: hypothetical protein EXR60_04870 [Dehalococcoidia bacterium]|nr:hypothetical protein [Dehalococcoidia bacterium]
MSLWRSLRAVTAVAVAAGLLLTACGGGGGKATSRPAPSTGASLSLSAANDLYSPTVLDVTAGQKVRLQIADIAVPHTFTANEFDVNLPVTQMGKQTIEFNVPVNASGDVPFFCTLHVGMGGTLKVEAP